MIATHKDIEVIELLNNEFYAFSQQIIETNYLQPLTKDSYGHQLPEKIKLNLKDGDLERPRYGAMHVGRAQFWAKILNEKIKEMFPVYAKQVINDLSAILGLNEKLIVTLIRYAILFRESARTRELSDFSSKDSSEKCYNFCVKQGLSDDLAKIFSQAAVCKDGSDDNYANFLKTKEIYKEKISSLQYIGKLIYLSDSLDAMRYYDRYRLENVLSAFKDLPEYQPEIHLENVIEIAKHVYAIIKKQQDMLYPCDIILPNDTSLGLSDGRNYFSLNKKVAIEHADNVCSVLAASIKEDGYFAAYLAEEKLLETMPAKVEPVFNPYLHGTNSFILPMLKRTHFTMLPSIEMLERYGMAPMAGELDNTLFGGGLDSFDPPRYICFGRMLSRGMSEYGLHKISDSYTSYSLATEEKTIAMIQKYANEALACGFENINKLLIHFARAKQLGVEPLGTEDYRKFLQQFNGVIQYYYFLALLGKHIYPDFELYYKTKQDLRDTVTDSPQIRSEYQSKIEKFQELEIELDFSFEQFLEMQKDKTDIIIDSIYTHLTFEKIVGKITDLKLDMKAVYENPTEENLKQVLSVLEFPKTSVILTGAALQAKKEVTLSETQFFSLSKAYTENAKNIYTNHELYLLCKNDSGNRLQKLAVDFFVGKANEETFRNLEKIVLDRAKILTEKLALVKKIAAINAEEIKFSAEEMEFMKNPFPIILICNAEEKISLHDFSTQEYRAFEPLKFGKDITTIIADTQEHQLLIMKFLKGNHVRNVQVVLVAQLLENKLNKKQPNCSYTHNDGFLKLAFFAAKAVPDTVVAENQNAKNMIDAAKQYQDIKLF